MVLFVDDQELCSCRHAWPQKQAMARMLEHSFLKEQRRKVDEVVTPDQRDVQPRRLHLRDRHPLRLQKCDHLAVGLNQTIIGAAGNPEQLEVGRLWVKRGKLVLVIEIVDRRGEATDPGEFIGIVQAGVERLKPAHGEACDGPSLAIAGDVVGGFGEGHDLIGQQAHEELCVVLNRGGITPDIEAVLDEAQFSITERHDDDHRFDLSLGKQVVEDEVRLLVLDPSFRHTAPAVKEVENGIGLRCMGVVARRRVDDDLLLICSEPESNLRGETMCVHGPVRNIGFVPRLRCLARDDHGIAGREYEI